MDDYDKTHRKRFAVSLKALRALWKPKDGARVIDIGWPGTFTKQFIDAYGITPESTNFNLSYEENYKDLESDAYDLVICMEVLEHLNDPVRPEWDLDRASSFKGEGAMTLLRQCYRILKSGGKLFLTTPNIASWHGVGLVLAGAHPMSYSLHVREYSFNYVTEYLLKQTEFKILYAWTEDVYDEIHSPAEMERMQQARALLEYRIDKNNRGETSFVFCEK